MNAIETRELTKKYKAKTAVDALTLSVSEGELFSLLGVNGAGKTTTIKMLSCLVKPSSGDASLFGNSILEKPEKVKQIIGVSPQSTAVAPVLSVRENLEFIAEIYGFSGEEARQKANYMIETFHLGEVSHSRVKTLSGGFQRRISIAMALISEPKILFLDEPTLGLDVLARRELWRFLKQLKGKMTMILTTHYLEEAEALSDRIGIMAKGKLCALGTAEELIRQTGTNGFEDAFITLCGEECGEE